MRSKERLIAALRCEETDRIPYSPFLAYWWDYAPRDIKEMGQFEFMKKIGADPLLRGFAQSFRCSDILGYDTKGTQSLPFRKGHVEYQDSGDKRQVRWIFPQGTLKAEFTYLKQANTWMLTEHPVKFKEDYKVLCNMVENMRLEADYSEILEIQKTLGDEGLLMAQISPFLKTPFQALIEHFVGTEKLVYDLYDFPEVVHDVLYLMNDKAIEAVRLAAEGPAEAFISWEDSSTMNMSPDQFSSYVKPVIQSWTEILHGHDKLYVHHACGHIKDLLDHMAEENANAIESISPSPTGNTAIWEAQEKLLPVGTAVIGGIDPIVMQEKNRNIQEDAVDEILSRMKARGFILANADSCPPDTTVETLKLIGEMNRRK